MLAALVLAVGIGAGLGSEVASGAQAELAAAAGAALEARCATCHSPEGEDPKARRRFDFAADLVRVAVEYVVPAEPELSELWLEIDGGTMPPPDSPTGPLTGDERAAVLAWIEAGAPLASHDRAEPDGSDEADVAVEAAPSGAAPTAAPTTPRKLETAGRFHPATVHFPIAFLIGAAVLEALVALRGARATTARTGVLVLARLAALTAPAVALLGWWNAYGSSASDALDRHRWSGVATVVLALVVWLLAERSAAPGRPRGVLRLVIVAAALVTALTGHFGGVLVFGDDYLPFPSWFAASTG